MEKEVKGSIPTVKGEDQESPAIYLSFSLRKLCLITAVLPVSSLLICFITANIFQKDEVHETHCRVYNIVPSISAITGISPQRYLWRTCVALHIGPRLLVTVIYRQYYRQMFEQTKLLEGRWLMNICFYLSVTEIVTLCGVTYVSNRENYPMHEKIFIVFLFSSLVYMLLTLKVFDMVHPNKTDDQKKSYTLKKLFFAASMLSLVGLFVFFVKHRFLCHDMAFSWFSICEYLIAFFNMAFHMTIILDFPSEKITVGKGLESIGLTTRTSPPTWKTD